MKKLIASMFVCSFLSAPAVLAEEAHVHGAGKLNVAIEGDHVHLSWETPLANIVGFEHEPKTKDEKEALHEAEELMEDAQKLFHLTEAANCKAAHAEGHEDHKDHEKEHHDDHGEEHTEAEMTYEFECEDMSALTEIKVNIFEIFPLTEELDVVVLSDKGQQSLELTPANSIIKLD